MGFSHINIQRARRWLMKTPFRSDIFFPVKCLSYISSFNSVTTIYVTFTFVTTSKYSIRPPCNYPLHRLEHLDGSNRRRAMSEIVLRSFRWLYWTVSWQSDISTLWRCNFFRCTENNREKSGRMALSNDHVRNSKTYKIRTLSAYTFPQQSNGENSARPDRFTPAQRKYLVWNEQMSGTNYLDALPHVIRAALPNEAPRIKTLH